MDEAMNRFIVKVQKSLATNASETMYLFYQEGNVNQYEVGESQLPKRLIKLMEDRNKAYFWADFVPNKDNTGKYYRIHKHAPWQDW